MQKDYFHIGEVETQELMQLLLTHFNHAENISAWRYKYQKENSPYYLELSCNEKGGIAEIILSKNFPREELESIEKKIQDTIVSTQGTRTDQVVGFCSEKITGHFRYKDLFQIFPIPKDAPESNMITADHPFILEVAYNASSDFAINQSRREKRAVVYSRLLNMLSNQPITLSPRYNQDAWVYVQKDTNNLTSEWKNLGYVYKGRKLNLRNFSDPENILPIERNSFNTYYGSRRGRTSKPFKLPDDIEISLDKALSLSTNKWKMSYGF